jgi:uncharacterized protein YodC (DUF2158 family)
LDPDLSQDDYAFQGAVLLMVAALVTGPDVSRLACFTKYPATFVAEISQRMRGAGLWKDGSVESEHWFDGEEWRTAAFWMDVLVGEGRVVTQRREDGKRVYGAREPRERQ